MRGEPDLEPDQRRRPYSGRHRLHGHVLWRGQHSLARQPRLITTVNVGAGVTKLTTNAFCGCTNLETVNFAENSQLQMLGGSAFKSCTSLKSITLPED